MRSKTVLTKEVAYKIKQMYAERDSQGRPRYTQMKIARLLGVGETTVYRAIKSEGAYRGLVEPKTARELEIEAEASQRRFAATMGLELPVAATEPEDLGVINRLEEAVAAERERRESLNPDTLVDELAEGRKK